MKKPAGLLIAMTAAIAMTASAHAEGDSVAGKAIFDRTCTNCHAGEIGVNKIGPSLWNVVGRPIATVPDFSYSEKMRSMRIDWKVWDAERLDLYLANPREVLHGVKMFFKGLPDAKDRADVIAYLQTFK
ncbi:MAG: c-type cytochrome [Rhodomicrobium sp.]